MLSLQTTHAGCGSKSTEDSGCDDRDRSKVCSQKKFGKITQARNENSKADTLLIFKELKNKGAILQKLLLL